MKERLNEIVFLRFFAVLSIVLGHCFALYSQWSTVLDPLLSSYEKFVFNQATPFLIYGTLPLFVCISGYLFAYTLPNQCIKTNGRFVKDKVIRLLVPGFIFSLLYLIFFENWKHIDAAFLFKTLFFNGSGHVWFLYMLFAVYIIGWFHIKYLSKKINDYLSLLISLLFTFILMFIEIPLGVGMTFFYYFFFYLGFVFFRRKQRLLVISKKGNKLLLYYFLLYISCFLFKVSFHYFIVNSFQYFQLFNHWFFRLIIGLIGCFLFMSYSLFYVSRYGLSNKIINISKYSFIIYLLHQFILVAFLRAQFITDIYKWLGFSFPVVLFLVVFIFTFYLSKLLLRNKTINKCLG